MKKIYQYLKKLLYLLIRNHVRKKFLISPWLVILLHISWVTAPQSPIPDIVENSSLISSVTPCDHQCHRTERRRLRIERRYRRIEWPPRDRRRLCIERRYRRIKWRVFECFMMFHDVLRVFHDVLLVVHDVLLVVHDVLWCITMF